MAGILEDLLGRKAKMNVVTLRACRTRTCPSPKPTSAWPTGTSGIGRRHDLATGLRKFVKWYVESTTA
ncbi:unnamed protein product [Musa acuminata subsp. malaccensis]|uniref:(wild Malaysian banana) hypothetical protein n=1 Tax=Musa acuminata subsp. malaccensis TaxID=214687 RepID=A0A804J973_MUSAM|nr:unnamed protein product [Musa acuminata subsp. malaccensis]